MRGRVARTVLVTAKFGITPAYAGKSPDGTKMVTQSRDHPRICGEEICEGLGCRGALGSPPRMRGRGGLRVRQWLPAGITPACAGKSKKRHLGGWKKGDHPRVCGEKLHPMHFPHGINRITPACAGKSDALQARVQVSGDHPRVCGEKRILKVYDFEFEGSPPRVRGKVVSSCVSPLTVGITPACAGKSQRLQVVANIF